MAENKTDGRYGKAAYVAPAIIGLLVIALILAPRLRQLTIETSEKPARPPAPADVLAPVVLTPPVVIVPSLLGRTELIETANRAIAVFAANGVMSDTSRLVGRKFFVRLPFGCEPAQAAPGVLQGSVQTGELGSTTLTLRPALWADLPLIQRLANPESIDSVEGFWIPRPWAATESCPPPEMPAPSAIVTPPTAQTLGLARIFREGESRAQRHAEHPYQLTLKKGATTGPYRAVLEGHLAAFPDGNALACWAESPAHHPVCLFSISISRVAFETAENGEILGQWDR
jgi:hypothetical protein